MLRDAVRVCCTMLYVKRPSELAQPSAPSVGDCAEVLARQRGKGQHSTAQHSTAQHSTAQHSTAQHSTAQHSTAQHAASKALASTSAHGPDSAKCSRAPNTSQHPWIKHAPSAPCAPPSVLLSFHSPCAPCSSLSFFLSVNSCDCLSFSWHSSDGFAVTPRRLLSFSNPNHAAA